MVDQSRIAAVARPRPAQPRQSVPPWWILAVVAASLPADRMAAAERPASGSAPNIVFILADDLGRADPGFMGGKEIRTPHLDGLARAGAVLDAHYVQPVCSPTRAALMTGRYATRTGVYTIVRPHATWGLPLEERTLAEALREAGYHTALCGKWHLGEFQPAYRPTRRGFDHQYGHWFGMIDYFDHTRSGVLDWHRNDEPCRDAGYSTHLIAEEACRRIRHKPPGKPLFLYLAFNAPHGPLQAPERYLAPYASLEGNRRAYAGVVAAMDEAVGQVIAALDEAKLRQDTLVVFSSDNGGPSPGRVTSNGPLRAGKGTIYEGGIRVCAFASWPGRIPAGTIRQPMHIVDWYPTLLKLAGGTLEQKLPIDGRDVWPMLTQGAPSPHDALLLCGSRPGQAAIRKGPWKLLVGAGEADADDAGESPRAKKARGQAARDPGESLQLYNLDDDIGERQNLADARPDKVRELREALDAQLAAAVVPGHRRPGVDAAEEQPARSKAKK